MLWRKLLGSQSMIFALCFVSLSITVLGQEKQEAYKYILDYDVPESPAFVALGVTPEKVLRGSSAKPVAVNLLSQIGAGQKLQSGVAVDFAPYFVFGGGLRNIDEYRNNTLSRLAANTQFSVGTVQSESDSNSLSFGLGLRTTLFDSHDLLQDKDLGKEIDDILLSDPKLVPRRTGGVDKIDTVEIDVSPAYERAKKRMLQKAGGALAIGYAFSGRLRNSIADKDSIDNTRHQTWLSYRYSFGEGIDFLSIYQGRFTKETNPEHRIGIAVKKSGSLLSFCGELVFTSITNRLEVGGVLEVKVLPRVGAVVSISSEQPSSSSQSLTKIRVSTDLRWNLSQ